MQEIIDKRSEILYLYDIHYNNPNGDAHDNRPRIDPEAEVGLVTDVRLKRTIRDYFKDKGHEIFIDDEPFVYLESGLPTSKKTLTRKDIFEKYDCNIYKIIDNCIDIRLFGATMAIKKEDKDKSKGKKSKSQPQAKLIEESQEEQSSNNDINNNISIIGPVQFKTGYSLHKIEPMSIKGTTVFASQEGKTQGTFTEVHIVPYELIVFYGIINEKAVMRQNLPLTESDVYKLHEAMWWGTNNLITRSKVGQNSRLLLNITYKKESDFFIGELDKKISIQKVNNDMLDIALRDITQVKLNVTELINAMETYKEHILNIKLKINDRVTCLYNDETCNLKDILKQKGFTVIDFAF